MAGYWSDLALQSSRCDGLRPIVTRLGWTKCASWMTGQVKAVRPGLDWTGLDGSGLDNHGIKPIRPIIRNQDFLSRARAEVNAHLHILYPPGHGLTLYDTIYISTLDKIFSLNKVLFILDG
jgi:hypothetical protein